MKRIIALLICSVMLFSGCYADSLFRDKRIPKGYIGSEEHYQPDGFQDFTDYCKYIYKSAEPIEKSGFYKKVEQKDIAPLKGYFDNMHEMMELESRLNEYDFDNSCITEGDYACIITKEGEKTGGITYGKYDSYTVYFFDTDTLTLFYARNVF